MKATNEAGYPHADVFRVSSWNYQDAILRACDARADKWGDEVRCRVIFGQDLPARDAICHKVCSGNFDTSRNIPSNFDPVTIGLKKSRSGRPVDASRDEAFRIVVEEFLEREDELTTISDLIDRMAQLGNEPYSNIYMKQKLVERFGDS